MNIYLLEQTVTTGYDTYDSCVVIAKNIEAAKEIHPEEDQEYWNTENHYQTWAATPDEVTATLIGKATNAQKEGNVVCSSFNAG